MSKEPEDFIPLLRLLALKRHEQPPGDYFDQLSDEISSRISAQTANAGLFGDVSTDSAGWIARLWDMLEARPALVGACGVAVSGMVLWGILSSPQTTAEAELARTSTASLSAPHPGGTLPVAMALASTNATLGIDPQLPPGFFDNLYQATPTPVSLRQP